MRGIAYKNPLCIECMVLLKHTHYVSIEPSLEQVRFGIPSHLAQIVLITGRLAIVVVLLIEALTTQRDIPRLRMDGLMAHRRTKRLNHPARAHQVGKRMEMMLAVKTHRQI